MKWDDLARLVLQEKEYEWDGLVVPFRHDGIAYSVEGKVVIQSDDEDWDNWQIDVWEIYLRTKGQEKAMRIEDPDEELKEKARIALREEANERAIESGAIPDPDEEVKPEREFNWEDLDESKSYDELRANFTFRGIKLCAYGDATVGLNEAEIKLYAILDEDGDEIDNPLPEIIRDAQYALQDAANQLAFKKENLSN